MVVFVGTSLFRKIILWVAMETTHFNKARISFQIETFSCFFLEGGIPTASILSLGSKVGPITSQGTCNMILIALFQRLFSIFRIFPHPKNTIFPQIFCGVFRYDTGHLPDTKT